jgi:hypothetical protein
MIWVIWVKEFCVALTQERLELDENVVNVNSASGYVIQHNSAPVRSTDKEGGLPRDRFVNRKP